MRGSAKSSASQSLSQTQSLYLIATNSDGRAVKVEVGSALTSLSVGIRGSSGNRGDTDSLSQVPVKDLFYYHTGSVWGLSTERRQGGTLIATVGEDKQLCVWDAEGHFLTCRWLLLNFTGSIILMYILSCLIHTKAVNLFLAKIM